MPKGHIISSPLYALEVVGEFDGGFIRKADDAHLITFSSTNGDAVMDSEVVRTGGADNGAFSDTALRFGYNFKSSNDVLIYFPTNTMDLSQGNAVRFRVKGTDNGTAGDTVLEFNLIDLNGVTSKKKNIPFISNNFIDTYVQFSDLDSAALDRSKIVEILIAIPDNGGGTGSITIDEMELIDTNTMTRIMLIDGFEKDPDRDSWRNRGSIDASENPVYTYNSQSVTGAVGNALEYNYDFQTATWTGISRNAYINASESRRFLFYFKTTTTASDPKTNQNSFYFFAYDSDSTLIKSPVYKNAIKNDDTWRKVEIPFTDMVIISNGADGWFKTSEMVSMGLTISRVEAEPSFCNFYVDEIQHIYGEDYAFSKHGQDLLIRVGVTANPFSPNGDGRDDETRFTFELSEFAHVRLRVYEMSGGIVYEVDADFPSRENSFLWDGRDNDRKFLRSGMYFYRITASAQNGRFEGVSHIIGLVR